MLKLHAYQGIDYCCFAARYNGGKVNIWQANVTQSHSMTGTKALLILSFTGTLVAVADAQPEVPVDALINQARTAAFAVVVKQRNLGDIRAKDPNGAANRQLARDKSPGHV